MVGRPHSRDSKGVSVRLVGIELAMLTASCNDQQESTISYRQPGFIWNFSSVYFKLGEIAKNSYCKFDIASD